MAINVTQAVSLRKSTRGFLTKSISNSLIKKLLLKSSRSPSGGNLQPWRIFVINKRSMNQFLEFQETHPDFDDPEYDIYPPNLNEPYRSSRYQLGEDMYSLLGIPREDKMARMEQVAKNFNFFGAPAGLFCFVDKQMGPPQWSDLGMFLQTFMLLAQESGISTCAQECWSLKHQMVKKFVGADDSLMLFCGMAIGYEDTDNPINQLKASREPIENWAEFI